MKKYTKKEIKRRAVTMASVYSPKDLRILRDNAVRIYKAAIKSKRGCS